MSAFGKSRACAYPVGASLCATVFFFAVPTAAANAAVSADFGNPSAFPTETNPVSVALGDLNGDGDLDMVAANVGTNNVSVLLGVGNGSFGAKVDFATGSAPKGVALGDMNSDGDLDIVTANAQSNNVSVLLGTGSGSFGAPQNFATARNPEAVVVADLNGDGDLDISAVGKYAVGYGGSSKMSVLLSDGAGGFDPRVEYTPGTQPTSVAAADVTGDGISDLLTANRFDGSVSLFPGTGGGAFGAPAVLPIGYGTTPTTLALGDLNEDGSPDVVTANGNGTVAALINVGNGTFGTPAFQPAGTTTDSVALGDVNGDGNLDAVAAAVGDSDMNVLLGNGSGQLATATPFDAGHASYSSALGDVNGDGKLDVALAQGNANQSSVLLNTSSYLPENSVAPTSGSTAGGTEFTIAGTNFTGATRVKFGSASATNLNVVSDTKITGRTPAGTDGSVTVSVQTPLVSVSSANAFRYDGTAQSLPAKTVPKKLRNPGRTVVNPVDSKTKQGQPVTATVRAKMRTTSSRGDVSCYSKVKGKNRKLTVKLSGQCSMRITVTYTAPATVLYAPFKYTKVYTTKRVR